MLRAQHGRLTAAAAANNGALLLHVSRSLCNNGGATTSRCGSHGGMSPPLLPAVWWTAEEKSTCAGRERGKSAVKCYGCLAVAPQLPCGVCVVPSHALSHQRPTACDPRVACIQRPSGGMCLCRQLRPGSGCRAAPRGGCQLGGRPAPGPHHPAAGCSATGFASRWWTVLAVAHFDSVSHTAGDMTRARVGRTYGRTIYHTSLRSC